MVCTSRKRASPDKRTQDAQAEFVEQRQHVPELARDVVFADQVHVVHGDAGTLRLGRHRQRFRCAHHIFEHRLAGDAVAEILGAVETGAIHRHHRHAGLFSGGLAHCADIVAGQCGYAGVVDEYGFRRITVDRLFDGMEQALLAAPHDDVLLGEVGGHADAVQRRAGRARAAVVPRTARAGDRPVHDVRYIGNGQQSDLRPVERTAARRRARLGSRTTGFLLLVMRAGRFVQQFGDVLGLHGSGSRVLTPSYSQLPCQGLRIDFYGFYK